MGRKKQGGRTKLTPFRFSDETLATLDGIAADLTTQTGVTHKRPDAIRTLLKQGLRASAPAMMPHYGEVPCGPPAALPDDPPMMLDIAALFRGPGRYLLTARGASMTGKGIADGDYLVISRQEQAEHGQTVVAVADGEVTLKVLHVRQRAGREEFWLYPASDHHQPIRLRPDGDNRILGVLVGVIRKC